MRPPSGSPSPPGGSDSGPCFSGPAACSSGRDRLPRPGACSCARTSPVGLGVSRTRSGASSGSPHPDRGGQPKRWIAGSPYGRSPAFACWFNSSTEYLAQGSPPTWWFPNASGFTLVRFFAQSGTCTGPGRRTQRPAKIRTSPTRLLIIQRRTESCTSGSGVTDDLSGLVTPEPEAGGMVGGLSGPSAPGRPPWGSLSGPADLTGGPPQGGVRGM